MGGNSARSTSASLSVIVPHIGIVARCCASCPTAYDFACGFQSNRSSGTRSSTVRVMLISWSNSDSSVSTKGIRVPAKWLHTEMEVEKSQEAAARAQEEQKVLANLQQGSEVAANLGAARKDIAEAAAVQP